MKTFYLAIACLLSPFFGLAQANFKKGYVVNTQGDTLRGFINYQELRGKEPGLLAFKTSGSDKATLEFPPATSRYAEITGLVAYQSFQGRISMDVTVLPRLSHGMDTTKQAVTIYLKVLQKEKNVSLFSYTDQLKTRFFLQVKEGQIQELGFKKYYYKQTNSVRTLKPFTGQLLLAAMDLNLNTPALQKQIASAQYQALDLVAIASILNELDPQQQDQQLSQRNNTRFFTGLSINHTDFSVKGQHPLASNAESKTSYLPAVSLGLDLFLNPHIQQLFFREELILHLASADISSKQQGTLSDLFFNQSFFQPTISLVSQLGYNLYNKENLKLNLGIGGAANFSAYLDNEYHTRYINRLDERLSNERKEKDHHQFTTVWVAFPIRAGLVLNQKTDISLLYTLPSAINRYTNFSFYRSSLQLGVHYLFKRK
jgi:hypothetical protein